MTYLATLDVPLDRLTPYPGNPRRGNVPVIEQSLKAHAQYRAVVVKATDRNDPAAGGVILAGNHTAQAARNLGWTHLRAEVHDVSDETARRIVAVDNRAADLGDYDTRLLAELLAELPDLDGTGYDPQDLDRLATELREEEDPEPGPDDAADLAGRGGGGEHTCPECGHTWTGSSRT
jgi:ParB-like chromosome segregation protein Spo0J